VEQLTIDITALVS